MITHLRSNAVAYLALFVALGGTSYAAVSLPKDSVGAAQIKKGAVRTADVKDGSLLGLDFKAGQLPAGPSGPAGATGPTGARGPAGVLFADQGTTPLGAPPAVPQGTFAVTSFTLPVAGKLFAYGNTTITAQCTGDVDTELGLYLDGLPLPASSRAAKDNIVSELVFTSVTATVPAGEHTLEIGRTCTGGVGSAGTQSNNYTTGVLLVGS